MNWVCDSQVMVEVRGAKDRIGEVSGWWNSPDRQYAKLPSAPEAVLLANSTPPPILEAQPFLQRERCAPAVPGHYSLDCWERGSSNACHPRIRTSLVLGALGASAT